MISIFAVFIFGFAEKISGCKQKYQPFRFLRHYIDERSKENKAERKVSAFHTFQIGDCVKKYTRINASKWR